MSQPPVTRRELLRRGAGAVVASASAALLGLWRHDPSGKRGLPSAANTSTRTLRDFFETVDFPESNPRLSVVTGQADRIEQMVRAAVGALDSQLGVRRFVRPGDVVLIKPNIGFDRPPALGATTHPEVVRTVVRLAREAGARRVLVTDSPIEAPSVCFARSGIAAVVAAESATLVEPRASDFEPVAFRSRAPELAQDEALGHWPVLWRPLAEATKLIGIAPVKDHNLCSASMNLKNWYGLLGGRRNQFHQRIHEIISDLALTFSPTLVVADATRVMLRSGPTGGRLSDVRPGGELGRPAVVAAVDPVACDAWCYQHCLGRDPAQLPYLELAARKIAAQGSRRFGEQHWETYARRGQIVQSSV